MKHFKTVFEYKVYEELSINAHPALQTQIYDGWILRYANGYTKRANSISPLYPSSIDINTKISDCEKRYSSRGLPTIFKLTDAADPAIDKALNERGYSLIEPTYVMEMDLRGKSFATHDCILLPHADEAWLDAYCTFSKYDISKKETAMQILSNVTNTMLCGRITENGETISCGSAVIEQGYMGLLNVVVEESRRRKGFGTKICESLLAEAKRLGAHTAYLQVVQENEKAVELYKKIGYKAVYSYWYRVKNA
ncbi:MAG: GNAT family N-acetyltransferase [Defluviitaleaceae bacterium]|nr:GNAT family N-acetyltransferase [Defluviitaleaceae bacterium]